MTRRALLVLLAVFWAVTAAAHEVPDRVSISVFVRPEGGRMLALVRMPANALIDFLLPTLAEGNWVDLANAGTTATDGANVWIADMLSLYENGAALPRPSVLAVRLSRVNDPAFRSFDAALARVQGPPLSPETLVLQDQITVDALLDTPITSLRSRFAFEPKFSRLGVVVDTSVTYVTPSGDTRQFRYQGDPERFDLDPARSDTFAGFVTTGFTHYFGQTDYLLFALCVALVCGRLGALLPFAALLVLAESVMLLSSVAIVPSAQWVRGLFGVGLVASTVYLGIEAIVAGERTRTSLALITGLVFGGGFWFGLQPIVQFGGPHRMAAALGFNAGVVAAELTTLVALVVAVPLLTRVSRAPRGVIVIAAALAIHLAWQRMLERADALALVPFTFTFPPMNGVAIGVATVAVGGALAFAAARQQRQARARQQPAD